MTDRELLEAAAKAEGHAYPWMLPAGFGERPWNPLTDDGDALRLAVRRGLFFKPDFFHFLSLERFVGQDRDDCHATRRAIVRAAAAIGGATGAGDSHD